MSTSPPLKSASPRRLANLLAIEETEVAPWGQGDLAEVLAHQLRAPIRVGVSDVGPKLAEGLGGLLPSQNTFDTFAKALRHPNPPLDLLRMIKDFAKAHLEASRLQLPSEVASVIYLASIAAALVHCHERISRADDASLQRAFAWAMEQTWVEDGIKDVLREASACLQDRHAPV